MSADDTAQATCSDEDTRVDTEENTQPVSEDGGGQVREECTRADVEQTMQLACEDETPPAKNAAFADDAMQLTVEEQVQLDDSESARHGGEEHGQRSARENGVHSMLEDAPRLSNDIVTSASEEAKLEHEGRLADGSAGE